MTPCPQTKVHVLLADVVVLAGPNEKNLSTTLLEVAIDGGTAQTSAVVEDSANPKWLQTSESMLL